MPTLIGRFNELLHQLSSSSNGNNSISSSNRPLTQPPSVPRSTNNRTSAYRRASISSTDRPTPVRRSNSVTSRAKTNITISSSSGVKSSSRGYKVEEHNSDSRRTRNRSSTPSTHHQRHPNHLPTSKPARRESSGRRQQLVSSRRRHSIASVTSAGSGNIGCSLSSTTTSNKKVTAPVLNSAMTSKNIKKIAANNNNLEPNVKSKVSVIKTNGDAATNCESEESLASKLARKMKISAITRKGSNCNSSTVTAHKSGNGDKHGDRAHKKDAKKSGNKLSVEAEDGKGCFIYRYLNGHLIKQHPDIISGKTCYDLPIKDIEPLENKVVASCTGPNGGILLVDCSPPKPFDLADEVDFIDEDYPDSSLSSHGADLSPHSTKSSLSTVSSDIGDTPLSSSNASPVCDKSLTKKPVAGIDDWNSERDYAYGVSISLYESHPITKRNAGDPIADSFAVCVRENSAIIALADGVNWGEKASLASRCAVYGCMDYLNNALYSPAESTRIRNTLDIFVALLRSFNAAHSLILAQGGHLTTLCAAVICQLKNSDRFIVCTCNVGDSLAYVYSPVHGVREITQGSHDIFSMRDMRDALGALGPVSGSEPELNNLTVAMTVVDQGDIVFLTSDGISDNFDPVVGKFAMPKKETETNIDVASETKNENSSSKNSETKERKATNKVRKAVQRSNSNPERSSLNKFNVLKSTNYTSKGLPLVSAQQRHELTMLRMEDLIMNGVNNVSLYSSFPKKTAKELCLLMVDFSTKLTMAKRRILEDTDLYTDDENDLNDDEAFVKQRHRRRLVGHRLIQMPGKLDHASIASVEIGFYGATAVKRANQKSTLHRTNQTNSLSKNKAPPPHSAKLDDDPRYNLKMKATLARFESQDFLECCCESGPI